jgi:secreted PhoX family phosphatase
MGLGATVVVGLGAAFWDDVFGAAGSAASTPLSSYGARRAADEHGIMLPDGFRSRLIARGDEKVAGTDYRWHLASDGAACFATADGGWVLVSNSETQEGGASAIRFDPSGEIEDAYRILGGTVHNCSGGATPWGTWLSCEEFDDGFVWECDPHGRRPAEKRAALGRFKHEAGAVDPENRRIYLTEDLIDGRFYRFTPTRWRDLSAGLLEVATVDRSGRLSWADVPDPSATHLPTRHQLRGTTPFRRAEGICHRDGTIYLSTTADCRVHAYDIESGRIRVIYDGLAEDTSPLRGVDQMTDSAAGELFVCEDIISTEIDIGVIDRRGRVSKFLSVTGPDHRRSELTGVTFDPSGSRMYFSSQRAYPKGPLPGPGAIYEVTGPFRGARA